jgi:hypothetical protein
VTHYRSKDKWGGRSGERLEAGHTTFEPTGFDCYPSEFYGSNRSAKQTHWKKCVFQNSSFPLFGKLDDGHHAMLWQQSRICELETESPAKQQPRRRGSAIPESLPCRCHIRLDFLYADDL